MPSFDNFSFNLSVLAIICLVGFSLFLTNIMKIRYSPPRLPWAAVIEILYDMNISATDSRSMRQSMNADKVKV